MIRLNKEEKGYIEGVNQKDVLKVEYPEVFYPEVIYPEVIYPEVIYPEVFYTGVLNYEGSTRVKKLKACGDAVTAWGHSYISKIPPKFGEVLVLLREFVEASSGTREGFLEAADRLSDSNRGPEQRV